MVAIIFDFTPVGGRGKVKNWEEKWEELNKNLKKICSIRENVVTLHPLFKTLGQKALSLT